MAAASTTRRAFRPLVAVAVAAVVFLAGMAVRGAVGDDQAGEARAAAPVVPDGTQGRSGDDDSNVPAGFPQSPQGARAAAVAYTATLSQRLLYVEPDDAVAAMRAVTASASSESLASTVARDLSAVREALAEGTGVTWWAVQPLAINLEAYSPERARASVWLVRVLSRQGVVVPQCSWVTESVELVWERGDWRLWSSTSTPGPTPVLDGSDMPASATSLDAELAGFELLDPILTPR